MDPSAAANATINVHPFQQIVIPGSLIIGVVLLWRVLTVLMGIHAKFVLGVKQLDDLIETVGTDKRNPPTGLMGKVMTIERRQDEHRDWFRDMGFDRRQSREQVPYWQLPEGGRRREDREGRR